MASKQERTSLALNADKSSVTLYEQVADTLRARILSGELAPGTQLPGESEMAAELGVSRATVRGALSLLQDERRISKQQGARSVVLPLRVTQTMAELVTLDEVMLSQGLTSQTRVLRYAFESPDEAIARSLDLGEGAEVLSVRRLHLVQSEPIALVDLAIGADVAAEFSRRDVEEHPFFDLLRERFGIHVGQASQRIHAALADEDLAGHLSVQVGAPILVCERVTVSDAGQPLIHAVFYYRGDRFEFQSTIVSHERKVSWVLPGLNRRPDAAATAEASQPSQGLKEFAA